MLKKVFFFITLFSICSCTITYRDIEFIDVHSISFSEEKGCSPICAEVKLFNPNNYSITIKDIDIEAQLNGKKIGGVVSNNKVKLPKLDSTNINLIFQSDTQQILSSLVNSLGIIFGKPQTLSFNGYLKAQAYLITKKVDIQYITDLKDLPF